MQYSYLNLPIVPNLDQLTQEILASNLTDKDLQSLRWEKDTRTLICHFTSTLSNDDRETLDTVIYTHNPDFTQEQFNINLFLYRFAQTFNALERLQFSRLAPSFTSELQFDNFHEIKQLRDYLVAQGQLSQENAGKITALFAEQNINLDTL